MHMNVGGQQAAAHLHRHNAGCPARKVVTNLHSCTSPSQLYKSKPVGLVQNLKPHATSQAALAYQAGAVGQGERVCSLHLHNLDGFTPAELALPKALQRVLPRRQGLWDA